MGEITAETVPNDYSFCWVKEENQGRDISFGNHAAIASHKINDPCLRFTFCHRYLPCMKLMMFLSNELIDTIPLCPESITLAGYLGKMKRELQRKYAALIECLNVEPEFLVDNPMQGKQRDRGQRKKK